MNCRLCSALSTKVEFTNNYKVLEWERMVNIVSKILRWKHSWNSSQSLKICFQLQLESSFSRQQKVSTSSTRQVGQQGSIFIEQEYPLRLRMKIMWTSHHNFVNNSTDLLMSKHPAEWVLDREQIFTEHFNWMTENLGKLFYFKPISMIFLPP